ncbi:hypothetical protein F511_27098 [Dorcoceras hygrometricum]|uniref:Uncharacterized protein n=1 Tax=Dorcoceras hygrometricum TaxID=472368 RepID=A0A2Z7AIP0_9LAMI|nr:hypothetical protein F511_27098 [Dorcoceras hygrometricum]
MVWFQCEDCGDNLKKPKLPNHFRICSASKLSCIDCGQVFGQQTVEAHTQCITESEKYGPKGQGKVPNGTTNAKSKNNPNQKPEIDVNVGLSERPPWFCSLCNTKTTSKQTLLLHADGKKHRAKARGYHASKQQPADAVGILNLTEKSAKNEVPESNALKESRDQNSSKATSLHDDLEVETHSLKLDKKRKLGESEVDDAKLKTGIEISADGNGEVIQIQQTEAEVTKGLKKAKNCLTKEGAILDSTSEKENLEKKIKWKKLVTSVLKSESDGVVKFKKLRKSVLKSLKESGLAEEKNQVFEMLEQKVW